VCHGLKPPTEQSGAFEAFQKLATGQILQGLQYWETLNIQVEILVEPMFQGKVSRETRWKWPHVEFVFLCHEVWTSGKWVSYEGAWKVGTILKLGLI